MASDTRHELIGMVAPKVGSSDTAVLSASVSVVMCWYTQTDWLKWITQASSIVLSMLPMNVAPQCLAPTLPSPVMLSLASNTRPTVMGQRDVGSGHQSPKSVISLPSSYTRTSEGLSW